MLWGLWVHGVSGGECRVVPGSDAKKKALLLSIRSFVSVRAGRKRRKRKSCIGRGGREVSGGVGWGAGQHRELWALGSPPLVHHRSHLDAEQLAIVSEWPTLPISRATDGKEKRRGRERWGGRRGGAVTRLDTTD